MSQIKNIINNNVILSVQNISKQYRLGVLGTGSISHDLNRWWHTIRGKEDPYLKIGETNDRSKKGESQYVWALKDISFDVKRGEVVGIIGKNGSGKSTLLKVLSKVTGPTTGTIKFKGRIASLLEVGTGFHPEMTGKENIFLNGAILGMTKKEISNKLEEIIEFSGCERYINTPVKRYSSGMKVRLAFAVAAFLEPDILVVDEVLAVGDAEFQKKAIGKMQDISKGEGRTVLFVSHDMTAIQSLCSRTILLDNGEKCFEGETDLVINEYFKKNKIEGVGTKLDSENIESIKINGLDSSKLCQIACGDDLNIEIKFKKVLLHEFDYCFIGVENEKEKRVFSVGTHLDKEFNQKFISEKILMCKIPFVNLVYGNYKLIITIGTNLPRMNKEIIRDSVFFEIIKSDYFGNGQSVEKTQGDFLLKSKWKLKDE